VHEHPASGVRVQVRSWRTRPLLSVAACVLLTSLVIRAAAAQEAPAVRADLSLRPGHHASWRTDRDGSTSRAWDFRTRLQAGVWWTPSPALAFRGRIAGRLSTDQNDLRFMLEDHVPSTDGIRQGEFTLDEALVRWRPDPRVEVRAGRMQTSFELAGVPRKSLDRNDSPNTDVSWTDGIDVGIRLGEGIRQRLILQRNGVRGPSNAVRGPLDASAPRSPVTLFASTQGVGRLGPLIQREIDLTVIPGASPIAGVDEPRGTYSAVVVRAAMEAPVAGARAVLGLEGGFAAGAPSRAALGTGTDTSGPGDGRAIQISANLMEIRRVHSFGVVVARAGDGWLISPDIRENNGEFEARYYWQYARWGRLDIRYRDRRDLRMRVGADRLRHDRDIYVRTTLRF
jgi:hypothetical protein